VAGESDNTPEVEVDNAWAASDLHHVRLAQIDPRAFGPLYERYATDVYNYSLRRLSHPEQAADAAATVFTRAIAALPKFRPDSRREGSTFRSWLFTIAHNVVVDHYRRRRETVSLDQHLPALETTSHLAFTGASPESHALHSDADRTVRRLLSHLPDRQRAIVELRLAGLSGAEIAHTLSMSASAIKSAQFRAYSTLRALVLADQEPNSLEETP
jgi:RNA polymerase sigma-70 factor (ECF subfamily)